MAIRVDPRRLTLLKELAAAEGLRPGQIVQRWVEERLDAERAGQPVQAGGVANPRMSGLESSLASLAARVDEMALRLLAAESAVAAAKDAGPGVTAPSVAPRRRGRPPKNATSPAPGAAKGRRVRRARAAAARNGRVGLHDEIIAVIQERGPSTAGELAEAIRGRGRYQAPRSAKPLDAATVNSRVSNPVYRARFRRSEGRISLAE
jgi:hypothetical protein